MPTAATVSLCFIALLYMPAFAQGPVQPEPETLTDAKVVQMVQSKVLPDFIILEISKCTPSFALDPASTQYMLQNGVTEEIVKAMAARQNGQPVLIKEPVNFPTDAPFDQFLSPGEVQAAISGHGRNHHVYLSDIGGNFLRDMATAMTDCSTCSTVDAGILVYLPDALIALHSELARRQYLPYTPVKEDLQRSLTVFAQGWVGTITTGCQSITRIVLLSDVQGTVVELPDLPLKVATLA